jgi:hypothetical protein
MHPFVAVVIDRVALAQLGRFVQLLPSMTQVQAIT